MKSLFFHIARLPGIPSKMRLASLSGRKLILPMYHILSDEVVPHVKHLYMFRTVKKFEEDLDYLLAKFEPVSVKELIDISKDGREPEKPSFLLTFDDGLREINDLAVPLLLKKGIPAIFFINPEFTDNKALFYRYKASILKEAFITRNLTSSLEKIIANLAAAKGKKFDRKGDFLFSYGYVDRNELDVIADSMDISFHEYLQIRKPYMTTAQLTDLSRKGFTIGAHSLDHANYSEISTEEQLRQTRKSIELVSQQFEQEYRLFAFPFTDHGISALFFNEVKPFADLTFGTAGLKNDSFRHNLQRIPMEKGNFSAHEIILAEYIYYLFKIPFGKNLIRRH